jgi:hypothetical protein
MNEVRKIVEVNGSRYELSKMTALVSSRIHGWLLFASVDYARRANQGQTSDPEPSKPEEAAVVDPAVQAEGAVALLWTWAASCLSEETLTKIQNYALKACSSFPQTGDGLAMPVMMAEGRWADNKLEQDAVAVNTLVLKSLQFSIAPFFLRAADSVANSKK